MSYISSRALSRELDRAKQGEDWLLYSCASLRNDVQGKHVFCNLGKQLSRFQLVSCHTHSRGMVVIPARGNTLSVDELKESFDGIHRR